MAWPMPAWPDVRYAHPRPRPMTTTSLQGIVLMRKGEKSRRRHRRSPREGPRAAEDAAAGVVMRPYYSRDRLVRTTVTTVMRNLVEGAGLVIVLLSLFFYNLRARSSWR